MTKTIIANSLLKKIENVIQLSKVEEDFKAGIEGYKLAGEIYNKLSKKDDDGDSPDPMKMSLAKNMDELVIGLIGEKKFGSAISGLREIANLFSIRVPSSARNSKKVIKIDKEVFVDKKEIQERIEELYTGERT